MARGIHLLDAQTDLHQNLYISDCRMEIFNEQFQDITSGRQRNTTLP